MHKKKKNLCVANFSSMSIQSKHLIVHFGHEKKLFTKVFAKKISLRKTTARANLYTKC